MNSTLIGGRPRGSRGDPLAVCAGCLVCLVEKGSEIGAHI